MTYVERLKRELVKRLGGFNPDDYFGDPSLIFYNDEVVGQVLEWALTIGYEQGLEEGMAGNAGRVKVVRYTEDGERDKTYISIDEAVRKNTMSRKTLYKALENGWKCGGYYWSREGEELDKTVIEKKKEEGVTKQVESTGIKVEKVEPSGFVVGGPYRSIRDAAVQNGLNDRYLGKVLDTDKLYAGHYWRRK